MKSGKADVYLSWEGKGMYAVVTNEEENGSLEAFVD